MGLLAVLGSGGCRTAPQWRQSADDAAYTALARTRQEALGDVDPVRIETPADTFRRRLIETQNLPVVAALSADPTQLPDVPHWNPELRVLDVSAAVPEIAGLAEESGEPVLTLNDALQLAAHGNRDYQARKETLFLAALALDLEEETFRNTLAGMFSGHAETGRRDDRTVSGAAAESSVSATRLLRAGARITAALALDLVTLLTQTRASAFGLQFDSSISIPLGRGAGRHIVMEPLTQAQRDLLTAVWEFEHFKAEFAVDVATRYFNVLAAGDQARNADDNLRRLQTNARRARRMAEAGRLPEIQVDQAVQEELRAAGRLLASADRYADALDRFKIFLGVPPDAGMQLDRQELDRLLPPAGATADTVGQSANPLEIAGAAEADVVMEDSILSRISEEQAVWLALDHRLDLLATLSRVEDAQRRVVVAADALGMDITLSADAAFGERRSITSANQDDASLRFDRGRYSSLLRIDLPLQRTSERNALRRGLIDLERAVRRLQEKEDDVKLQARATLRALRQAHKQLEIQAEAMQVAHRRVSGSDMFLDAGRAAVRDVLEAQDALFAAQNAYTDAVVACRLIELEVRRTLGMLPVSSKGLWDEWGYAGDEES